MKKKEDERGYIVRIYEAGDGMRRRFYDALEDSRFSYPRRGAFRHALRWYCDGHLSGRPVNGIWTCAVLAEHLLAGSRSSGRPRITDAAAYFASTRRAMRQLLSHHKVTTRLTRRGVADARRMYARLCSEGTELLVKYGYLTPSSAV